MAPGAELLAPVAGAARDLLAGAGWTCLATAPGLCERPSQLPASGERVPAQVPGTAASALRAAGVAGWRDRDYDASDWWFVTTFEAIPGAAARLVVGGLATLGEVWCNDRLTWSCPSMFVPGEVVLDGLAEHNELALCCRALAPQLARRAGRPRWRNTLVERQSLRGVRTTLLGRIPGWAGEAAPVGPWRPLRLETLGQHDTGPRLVVRRLAARLEGADGLVELDAELLGTTGATGGSPAGALARASLRAAGCAAPLAVAAESRPALPGAVRVRGRLVVPDVQPWWPHTHGEPARYEVVVELDAASLLAGRVGFRTVAAEHDGGGFALALNGTPVFARGACWVSPDAVSLAPGEQATRAALAQLRDAGCNLVRLAGTATYEDEAFFEACDELGLLVWQDCMLANLDPPEDEEFRALLAAELRANLGPLAGRACLAVVSGGSEIEQQAAMSGVARDGWASPVLDELIPGLAAELVPGVPYLRTSPTGGTLPFQCDSGVAHYFGVGAYMRPLEDARRAGVRFAAECLAFSTPPEPATLEELAPGVRAAGHHPDWKRAVPRDGGASWDFEDVRDHYVEQLFGVDARRLRYGDPARALDLGRAAVAECFAAVLSEWRRPGSGCAGAVVLSARDLLPGAGWGVVDAAGRPKAPWYVMRRLLAPLALLLTDEGLNGLRVHVVNDTPRRFDGRIELTTYRDGAEPAERGGAAVVVGPAAGCSLDTAGLLEGFRDLTYAYRFGPPSHDVVQVVLRDDEGRCVAEECYLPLGPGRPVEADLGIDAKVAQDATGAWSLACSTTRFAQWVALDLPGWQAADSWFHLAPGSTRTVALTREPRASAGDGDGTSGGVAGTDGAGAADGAAGADRAGDPPPRGEVRALNARWPVRVGS